MLWDRRFWTSLSFAESEALKEPLPPWLPLLEAFPLAIKGNGDNVTCQGMCPEYLTKRVQNFMGQWQRHERDESRLDDEETESEPGPGGRLYAESMG